ncbi:hypothetical protein E3N88_14715 [Mikania micrantha]|uniref:F-box domain-containing protein n=1 Tax=Mikania micrantha TaxID=192012 RepID=A0A5N6P594_9ASTR|nr:hypothetical protein E3N88_14715 [Mikania micrantha]
MEAKRSGSDMIKSLPADVIESILCLLPFKEAVRTSIICREWRYYWTKVPNLVFIEDVNKESLSDDDDERLSITRQAKRKFLFAINQVMSMHQSPIHEFSLSMCPTFGLLPDTDDSTIVELMDCLPLIESLSICLSMMKGRVPKKLPTPLVRLKCLCIRDTSSVYKDRIPLLALLIRSSPNLEKLNLKIVYNLRLETTLEDYSDMRLEHLNEIEIESWRQHNILEFVKLLMAKSPALKKVRILLRQKVSRNEELKISRIFLQYQCASPAVQIFVRFT